ncbi:hypothetical protein GCM10022224_075330 [Nonomuraea antimicrobica]|uniref:FXSXX-COOH protein n=1 Tax=Nonomuraea antimicrobica TaxID=561173 RepID=A0ABP7D290_9ACTN
MVTPPGRGSSTAHTAHDLPAAIGLNAYRMVQDTAPARLSRLEGIAGAYQSGLVGDDDELRPVAYS